MDFRQDIKLVLLPGLWDSGPEHWQSHWENLPNTVRVRQKDWETPDVNEWVAELDRIVSESGPKVVIAAHSLGCATVAHWAQWNPRRICGALLVAPSDVDASTYPVGPTGFSPMPMASLPFRSILVRSSDDPYVTVERAAQFAAAWGSELVTIDNGGHLNSASNLGMWSPGLELVDRLGDGCRSL